jgi:hypothetical protein
MIKLHVPLWELFAYGAGMFLVVVAMIGGQMLKGNLRGRSIEK